jgi:hypothetical protein
MSITEDAIGVRLPYELVPTNLAGVFSTPAPPEDFDLRTASDAAMIKQGLMWRRPTDQDDPAVHALWERVSSRSWSAQDRIIPESEPQVGKTHFLRGLKKLDDGSYTSDNWGGGVLPGAWVSAVGTWVIPTVSEPPEPQGGEGGWNSSSWVGIDGAFGSNDVLQAGIQQHINAQGQAGYVAWYEWYAPIGSGSPAYVYQTNIGNFPVSPGQTVYASIQYVNKTGQITFANDTTGQHFSITLAPPPGASMSGNTAEWIMEAPDGGETHASLPRFTPVVFTSALACPSASGAAAGNPDTGDTFNVVGFGKTLTSVTLASDEVTIDFTG